MRIWDLDPGYLSRGHLLAEHRELHALMAMMDRDLPGFENQPELARWRAFRPALCERHHWLVQEFQLRGLTHRSPLADADAVPAQAWPGTYVTAPAAQFALLAARAKTPGRIPLPASAQELWAQHKYSVMARDPQLAKSIGREVAAKTLDLPNLALQLTALLRQAPAPGRTLNALQHMWGYVADCGHAPPDEPLALLRLTQRLALEHGVPYLTASTALGELARYLQAP